MHRRDYVKVQDDVIVPVIFTINLHKRCFFSIECYLLKQEKYFWFIN